ncbi:hypothetical protein HanOQP8_Chr13g0490421 [Helianthus annuus]|nr:hypothetical protein HanLR1_Chr13g0491961 [Helianthus annuus]KAJ0671857.1 hypothetical protein HanOQP8_Chr13g0490421 [Helianthus annuus]
MKGAKIVDTKVEQYMQWPFSVYSHESAIPNMLFFPHTGALRRLSSIEVSRLLPPLTAKISPHTFKFVKSYSETLGSISNGSSLL